MGTAPIDSKCDGYKFDHLPMEIDNFSSTIQKVLKMVLLSFLRKNK